MEIMDFDNVDVDKIHVHKYLLVSTYKDWRRYSRQYGLNEYRGEGIRSSIGTVIRPSDRSESEIEKRVLNWRIELVAT